MVSASTSPSSQGKEILFTTHDQEQLRLDDPRVVAALAAAGINISFVYFQSYDPNRRDMLSYRIDTSRDTNHTTYVPEEVLTELNKLGLFPFTASEADYHNLVPGGQYSNQNGNLKYLLLPNGDIFFRGMLTPSQWQTLTTTYRSYATSANGQTEGISQLALQKATEAIEVATPKPTQKITIVSLTDVASRPAGFLIAAHRVVHVSGEVTDLNIADAPATNDRYASHTLSELLRLY